MLRSCSTLFVSHRGLTLYSPARYGPIDSLGPFYNFYRMRKLPVKLSAIYLSINTQLCSTVVLKFLVDSEEVMSLALIGSCHKLSWKKRVLKLYVWCKYRRHKNIFNLYLFFSELFPNNVLKNSSCPG